MIKVNEILKNNKTNDKNMCTAITGCLVNPLHYTVTTTL